MFDYHDAALRLAHCAHINHPDYGFHGQARLSFICRDEGCD